MAHKTVFNLDTGIIETRLEGKTTFNEIKEVISKATRLAQETKCYLWLNDARAARLNLSTMEIYGLPGLFSEAAASLQIRVFQIKRAIVISNDKADYLFARTLASNRGQNLELFDEIEKARKWLKTNPPGFQELPESQ